MGQGEVQRCSDLRPVLVSIDRDFIRGDAFWAIEHHDISQQRHQMARGLRSQFRGERFLLLFEVVEFYFDQFVRGERGFDRLHELRTHASFANFKNRFEALGIRFQFSNFSITERRE